MGRRPGRRRKSRTLKKIRNNIIFWLAGLVRAAAARVPLAWGLPLGAWMGRAAFAVWRPDRNKALTHLRVAFPEKSEAWRIEVGRQAFMNLGRAFFELFHFEEILDGVDGKGRYQGYLRIKGEEHMARQIAGGRGGLIVTGHCGNWELMAAYTAKLGYPVSAAVRELYDPRFDKLLNDHRERFGYHPIMRDTAAAGREILRALRKNRFVALLMDQDAKVRSLFVPFFGHPARTPSGPATLAYHLGMDALTAFIHRRPDGGHMLVIGPPVPRPQTGDREADILEYTAILTKCVEDNIRRHPDEWVWMHRRWKKRPAGEPPEKNPVAKS